MDEELKKELEGIELARKLLLRKKTKEAEDIMNLILDGEPPDAEVYLEIFRNYHEFGMLKKARIVIELYGQRMGSELLDPHEKNDFESDEKSAEENTGRTEVRRAAKADNFYNTLFGVLIICAVISILLFEFSQNDIFIFGFKYLYLPVFVFVFISSKKYGLPLGGRVFGSKTLLVAVITAILTIFAGPAAGLVNGFLGKQTKAENYYVADRQMELNGRRFYLVLKEQPEEKAVKWQVKKEVYDRHNPGDKPDLEIMIGSLGIRYIKKQGIEVL